MSNLPTLSQLNTLTPSQNNLVLLRTLFTSDMAFSYMLLNHSTITDIVNNVEGMLCIEANADCHGLTNEEHSEFSQYCKDLKNYVNQ